MSAKISELQSLPLNLPSNDQAALPVEIGNNNYKIKLADLGAFIPQPTKASLGLDQVANIAPANLPISNATMAALNGKADINHVHTASSIDGYVAPTTNFNQSPTW